MSSSESSFAPDEVSDSESALSVDQQPHQLRTRRSSSRVAALDTLPDEEFDSKPALLSDFEDGVSIDRGPQVISRENEFGPFDDIVENLSARTLGLYSSLLTEIKNDINFSSTKEDEELYNVHQNGAVIWTATEKEVLYNVLDRKGKNGIKEIAAAIGTKSELEVLDHLRLLQQGLQGQHRIGRHVKTIVMGDVPGAAEISEACCAELDEYAQGLRSKEELAAAIAGRTRFGENWNVDSDRAEQLLAADENVALRGDIQLPAGLLNLPTWVKLQQRFFMNFGGSKEDDNWMNLVTSRKESPSLSGEALMDLYALAVSITRRLIQSVQFIAMSRIRSQSLHGRERANAVRRKDVKAAMEILNMRPRRDNFLLDVARNNELVIEDSRKTKGWKTRELSYNEAEEILNGETDYFRKSETDAMPGAAANDSDGDEELDDAEDVESDEDSIQRAPSHAQDTTDHLSTTSSEVFSTTSDSDTEFLDLEEEHADTLDREHSRVTELHLWQMLGKPPPPKLEIPIATEENDKEAFRKPPAERKAPHELVDWRDRVLYRGEWEEFGYEAGDVEEALIENRRKKRRTEQFLSASVVNSEDDESSEDNDTHRPQLGAEEHTRVEPPKYGSAGWEAFLQSFLTPGEAPSAGPTTD
ncbi:hypothetical protein N7539_000592 [Penicillium diatomitis]|uniref:Myb-like domain-containing protein n=1 Tax=Penicillium diatomitis TaxID=2819901 RepID=A0A9X0C2H5_9EURO|nr:uncharacterized protein N7539_000592 [Penicillium diatomitis]KAJ5495476.1 hypothetical protein N7539_000592 [Penicillium diatomitis]